MTSPSLDQFGALFEASRALLGLGNAAERNVGNTAGTVAAGDDPRFNGGVALPPVYGGAIQCDAEYDVDANGFGNYRLTAKSGVAIVVTEGCIVEFAPPATMEVGAANIWIDTVNFGGLYGPSGGRLASFQEIRKGQPARLRYHAGNPNHTAAWMVASVPLSYAHAATAAHGKFSLTTDFSNGTIRMQGWDGGNALALVMTPETRAYDMTEGPVEAHIWNGTATVNGQPNSACLANKWYYQYLYMPEGAAPSGRKFDFDDTLPSSNYMGFLAKQTDISRTMVGFLYTFDGNISFRTTGVIPTIAIANLYNAMLLHMESDPHAVAPGAYASWTDLSNARCRIVVNAETNLPHFMGICNAMSTQPNSSVEFRLKFSGIDATTGIAWQQFTPTSRATIEGANAWRNLFSARGAAFSTGTCEVTPQFRFVSGAGAAEAWVSGNVYM